MYMMKQRIDIETKTFVRFFLVVAGFVLIALAITSALQALIILGISFFLALALNSPVTSIARRLPGRSRVGATAIAYILVIVVLSAVVFLVVPPMVQQTAKFAQGVPALVDSASQQWDGWKGFVKEYNLQPQVDSAIKSLEENTSRWAGNVGQTVVNGIGSFFGFLGALILVLVLTFLMLIEGPMWMKKIWSLYEKDQRVMRHKRIIDRMYVVINGYVTGQLTISALGATFSGLVIFALSFIFPQIPISLALTTAAVMFVLALIPMFGSAIGATLITLLAAFNSWPAALTFVIIYIVYQQIENNFIAPKIQSKKLDLTPLIILSSLTIGLYVFGLAGGIIAIPIAGCVRILIEEYLDWSKSKKLATPAN